MRYKTQTNQRRFPAVSLSGLKHLIIALILCLCCASSALWAEVTASTGRTVLSIDETIVLEIKSKNGSGEPDLIELENDFQILGRSQSQNYSLINGQSSRTHTWSITLLPKKTGEITIPSIKVGNDTTDPIHLVVQKQSSTPGLDGKDVFLKIELSDNNGQDFYVQQQIMVKIQLFHRIRFTNATLSDLELNNTVIEKLGNDSNYTRVIGNNRYNIIEQNYAIYPQQSGALTIAPLTFTGNTEISQNFSLFSRPGRQIISRTKPITLNILPIPDSYTGKHWLPAETLELEAEILEDTNAIKAGEAITRHIIVRATGLLGSQLPANTMSSSDDIKTYPDKEKLNTQLINGKVVGTRRDTIAIIPIKSGAFTLPEITIDWWNTKTHQQEKTHLPARHLLAQRNGEIQSTETKTKKTEIQNNELSPSDKQQKKPEKTLDEIVYKQAELTKNIWFWISMALVVIWLMTIALFLTGRSKNKVKEQDDAKPVTNNHEKYLQALYDACHKNDPHQATVTLIKWARCFFKQPLLSGLSQIIEQVDNEHFINALMNLESAQYSSTQQQWNGDALSSAVDHFVQQKKARRKAAQNYQNKAFAELNPCE